MTDSLGKADPEDPLFIMCCSACHLDLGSRELEMFELLTSLTSKQPP